MDIKLFSEVKSTRNIIGFDEKIEDIPRHSLKDSDSNPLDKRVPIGMDVPGTPERVFYLPYKEKTIMLDKGYHYSDDLSKAFGCRVYDPYIAHNESASIIRSFVYCMVMGEYLVYRWFDIAIDLECTGKKEYRCTMSEPLEKFRYVFYENGIFIEDRDGTVTFTGCDRIQNDKAHDILLSDDGTMDRRIRREFMANVRILNKNKMVRALSKVRNSCSGFCFSTFLQLYRMIMEPAGICEGLPERIARDLYEREYRPGTALKLESDLAVVVGYEYVNDLVGYGQIRAYFDHEKAYFFRKNPVTDDWTQESPDMDYIRRCLDNGMTVDKDIFDNTCFEKYAANAVSGSSSENSIDYGTAIVQMGFLSAEQAAKTDPALFDEVLHGIRYLHITDPQKTLPELFGVSGPQLKFLHYIDIPHDIDKFADLVNSEDFKEHFPDIKKRIFAVSVYMNGYRVFGGDKQADRELLFEASQTIDSLEKIDPERRDHLTGMYVDYLSMYQTGKVYFENMRDYAPIKNGIDAFAKMPVNMKPSRIEEYHRKVGRIIALFKCSWEMPSYSVRIEEIKREKAKAVEYSNGEYSIILPRDAADIVTEGTALNHCVGQAGYIGAMAQGQLMILFLRENKRMDIPLITIEERNGGIKQCYGHGDSYNHNPEIRDFIKEYANRRGLSIDTTIYSREDM